MNRRLQYRTLVFLIPCLSTACGNDGVDKLNDGSGASGSHGSEATSAGTEPGKSLCDRFCAATGTCYEDCHATCETYQGPPCANEGLALVTCDASSYDAASCSANQACENQYEAFYMCRGASPPQSCAAPTCGATDASCACTAQCVGGEEKAICDLDLNGDAECSCYLNGSMFSTCGAVPAADHSALPACSLTTGCCMFSNGGG
jgi:hypothetical protein